MRLATLAFLSGILLVQTFSRLPAIHESLFLLPLLGLILSTRVRWLCFFLLGILWSIWRADLILTQTLPTALEGQDVTVTGHIVDLPIKEATRWRFLFASTSLTFQNKHWPVPKRLRLSWYKNKHGVLPDLYPGQHWSFTVRLKRARSTLNPGIFDYSRWLFQQGIRATGYVRGQSRLLGDTTWHIDYWRYQIMLAMQQALGNHTSAGMLIALVLGTKQAIPQSQREILQRAGIMHLMVISGLHIGLIATLIFGLTQWFCRYMGVLWLSPVRFAALLSIINAFAYALLAGFSLPTQRALIMLSITLLSIVLPRITTASHILSLALFIVLIYDPLAVLNTGFWFTFGIVSVLLYLYTNTHQYYPSHLLKWGVNAFKTQLIITLAMLPLLLSTFGYIPLTAFIANAIAVPWMSLVIIPLTLISTLITLFFPLLGQLLLNLSATILDALWVPILWLAELPISQWYGAKPPMWTLPLVAIGLLVLFLPRGFPGRWLGIIGFLPLFFFPIPAPQLGEVWFTVFDVGQGLATVVRTQQHVLVYDTGLTFSKENDSGKMVIVPFLRNQGIRTVDTIIVSHSHDDHSGGVKRILKALAVNEVYTSHVPTLRKRIPHTSTPLYACQAGQQWHWDRVHFQIIHPAPDFSTYLSHKNNHSCVLKVTANTGSILLTGDIQEEAETYLATHYANTLKADILLVPHHGSKTSSDPAFLKAVNPKWAVVSTGYLNRWRFPHQTIIQRYARHNIPLFNTVSTGALTWHLTTEGIQSSLARKSMRRYWHE